MGYVIHHIAFKISSFHLVVRGQSVRSIRCLFLLVKFETSRKSDGRAVAVAIARASSFG